MVNGNPNILTSNIQAQFWPLACFFGAQKQRSFFAAPVSKPPWKTPCNLDENPRMNRLLLASLVLLVPAVAQNETKPNGTVMSEGLKVRSMSRPVTRWWQLKYFLFSPRKLGKIPRLTNIFFRWVGSTTNQVSILHISDTHSLHRSTGNLPDAATWI